MTRVDQVHGGIGLCEQQFSSRVRGVQSRFYRWLKSQQTTCQTATHTKPMEHDMADLAARVDVLDDWRKNTVDPGLENLDERMTGAESIINKAQGSFGVIKWLLGVNTALLVALIATLAGWALQHVTLRVESAPASITSTAQPQNADSTPHYVGK